MLMALQKSLLVVNASFAQGEQEKEQNNFQLSSESD
jgi:hypothetical protein